MARGRIGRAGLVVAVLLLFGVIATSFAQSPADKPKREPPTPEQKQLYTEMHAKTEAIKKDCMAKMQAVRQEYEPRFKALGMPMPPGGPRGGGSRPDGPKAEGPKPGPR